MCEPELVVHAFTVGVAIRLIQGNLHIRIPHDARVSKKLRTRLVQEALRALESEAPNDSAAQPVVLVLVGDCNLLPEQAEEATQTLQPVEGDWRTVWQVHPTTKRLSGDLIFVKGAHASSFDLPFGCSHRDRGVRHDQHDAIGIELRVNVEAEPEPASKTRKVGDASQLVRGGDDARGDVPQRARGSDDARQLGDASQLAPIAKRKPRNCLSFRVGEHLEKEIRDFLESRGVEGMAMQREVKQLRHLLF